MDIDDELVCVLKNIHFADRYKNLCEKYSDIDNSMNKYDKTIIKSFYESKGLKVSFIKSESFFKVVEKIGKYRVQFNIIPKRGFLQFVLDVKKNNKRLNLGWGMWESITQELTEIESSKPIFGSYEELEKILGETLSIYEDFKYELFKQDSLNEEKEMVSEESLRKKTELEIQIEELVELLKHNNKPSFKYFEEIADQLNSNKKEALRKLSSSFSIIQYANFTKEEENKLSHVIQLSKDLF